MTDEAVYEFKCRKCGKVYDGPHTGEPQALMYLIQVMIHGKSISGIGTLNNYDIHHCEDGGVGVSDIIGYYINEK